MSEATPRPWNNSGGPDKMIVCDAEGGSVADCAPPGPWMRQRVAEANAALIIHAVNNISRIEAERDALRKALEDCRTSYCGYAITKNEQYPGVLASFWRELQRIDKIAREALGSAETDADGGGVEK